MMGTVLYSIDLPGFVKISSGKVREIFQIDDMLLLVASDRLSAFDVVFAEGIPGKGKILTQLSAFWFDQTRRIVPNHFITAEFGELPEELRAFPELEGRATLCHRAKVIPIECIARGYLEGSAWKEYQQTGGICGLELPKGLRRRSKLPEPIFTPSTKAERGVHDENITYEQCGGLVGCKTAQRIRDYTLALYKAASEILEAKEIVLADTKFEFGMLGGEIILLDEILTPDSSRFWVKGSFEAGGEPLSFDKQYVRDYLETTGWNKTPPPPSLPEEVVINTAKRYQDIFAKITGRKVEY